MTGVMGFLAQCEICPQKAILTDQPDGWVCPRCTEATAPAFAGPMVQRGDRVAVQLADGTLRTGPYNPDSMAPDVDADTMERGRLAAASPAGDPIPEPQPLTIPVDDPLAAAIVAEVQRNPNGPLIGAVVNGRRFQFGGYTQTKDQPLSTVWIDQEKMRMPEGFTHYPWGDPVEEAELPYRPPAKHHAYRAPLLADDDELDLGSIRG